jgi:hypothetical protein
VSASRGANYSPVQAAGVGSHGLAFFRTNSRFLTMSRVLKFIPPQLASPVDRPPEGKHWIHEIKYDGYRCQVLLERGQARVLTGMTGATAILLSSERHLVSDAGLLSLMVRPLYRTATGLLTLRP